MSGRGKYSCETAVKTVEWIHAIIDFLKPFSFFLDAHVVNFFKDKLWEAVDKEWFDCLRNESIGSLLQIPSGVIQDYWPASLKKFIITSRSLAFPREQADLQKVLPDLHTIPLNSVLALGMNRKKKHEIEVLAGIVDLIARSVGAGTVVDVGAGQGYLAQVLSFEYQLPVIAIDACSHHGRITDARAERIKKHYAAKLRKSRSEVTKLIMPKTVTCRILSADKMEVLSSFLQRKDDSVHSNLIGQVAGEHHGPFEGKFSPPPERSKYPLLLAGLHACGDLSVTMLRTFLECDEVKAVVSIGCCYNLLSEVGTENVASQCGFPMSKCVNDADILLGKSSRDLACQSAERWNSLGRDAGLHNFELHAFRAAFQMVLFRYYPEILVTSPTIGRQGKAFRRRQNKRILESHLQHEITVCPDSLSGENSMKGNCPTTGKSSEAGSEENKGAKFSLFEKFSQSGLRRLGLPCSDEIDFSGLWKETEPFSEFIGPYWSLRAALGPVLETLFLLDRLLFLQER